MWLPATETSLDGVIHPQTEGHPCLCPRGAKQTKRWEIVQGIWKPISASYNIKEGKESREEGGGVRGGENIARKKHGELYYRIQKLKVSQMFALHDKKSK